MLAAAPFSTMMAGQSLVSTHDKSRPVTWCSYNQYDIQTTAGPWYFIEFLYETVLKQVSLYNVSLYDVQSNYLLYSNTTNDGSLKAELVPAATVCNMAVHCFTFGDTTVPYSWK